MFSLFGSDGQQPVWWRLWACCQISVFCFVAAAMTAAGKSQNPSPSSSAYDAVLTKAQHEKQLGHLTDAIVEFGRAVQIAQDSHDLGRQARALISLSGCQIRAFQYRQGLGSAESARQLALEIKDDNLAGAAANNRATIYSQVGDNVSALQAARESIALLQHSSRKDYLAKALLNYGDIQAQLNHMRGSVDAFAQAVSVAHSVGLSEIEAAALSHLGDSLLDLNDLAGAERALKDAHRLCEQEHDSDQLDFIDASLAELDYHKGNFTDSLKLLDRVFTSRSDIISTLHPYWLWHLRGKILLALARRSEALRAFNHAVMLANVWRRGVLPADASSIRGAVALHEVYRDYVELAAELAIRRRNPTLARQAFDTLVENRASDLREEMLSALSRQMSLPPRYLDLLSKLQAAQAEVTLNHNTETLQGDSAKLGQIRLELTDFENGIGLYRQTSALSTHEPAHVSSLRSIQRSLSGDTVLLSFCLNKSKSFLWAVTRKDINLYELPPEDKISAHAKAFTESVRKGSSSAEGVLLIKEMFGKLEPGMAAKTVWLIAADGALLDSIPFAALPQTSHSDSPLVSSHTLRFIPSELLLTNPRAPEPQHGFLGVADPIYNLADSRRPKAFTLFPPLHGPHSVILARLVGSEREVRLAAATSSLTEVKFLTGVGASSQNLRAALANPPEILHFAVHVLSPPNAAEEAALALSLTGNDMPELLTKEIIATLRVPGSLVVLSGCSSQQGQNLPSAGIVGLSRAWLLAGASAVVVSAWPTPDYSGLFFKVFYRHFRLQASDRIAQKASLALRQTQEDMRHSGDFRSLSSFWAAYSLISQE